MPVMLSSFGSRLWTLFPALLALLLCVPGQDVWAAGAAKPRAERAAVKASTARVAKVTKAAPRVLNRRHAASRSLLRTKSVLAAPVVPAVPSFGQASGLHLTEDPLALRSSVAFVMDQDTSEVLLSKNSQAVLPIASLTKLMTALLVVEAGQSLEDELEISADDVDTEKGSHSRLVVGTRLSRGELLHLALMSSENRAAHALGRYYPGGLQTFVAAMNQKAQQLGMRDTHYVEPTGLSSKNQSTAPDLAKLVKTAYGFPLLRELSTSPEYQVAVGKRMLQFHTTNRLVLNPQWDIGLQKTGYIAEAGRCLVLQARLAGRKLIMVFLDSAGKYSRIGDAERVRHWIEQTEASVPRKPAPVVTPVATRSML
jgi:D-alanyl-D-alanine endopeptidase (penicillin-binding protein 7)